MKLPSSGQAFELAFPLDTPEALDRAYAGLVAGGAIPLTNLVVMPWGKKTAFFADPEGNIHELFADLPGDRVCAGARVCIPLLQVLEKINDN